jgi:hypothetical protein
MIGATKTPRHQDSQRTVFASQRHAFDAILDAGNVEIDQQAEAQATQLQIGKQLGLEQRIMSLHGLDFHDQMIFDHQINAESGVYAFVPIDQWDGHLPLNRDTSGLKFQNKASLINRLQQSGAERTVHRKRSIDNLARDAVANRWKRCDHLCALVSLWPRMQESRLVAPSPFRKGGLS